MYKGKHTNTIYYNEDILKMIRYMREFLKKVKTQDYYVRGFEDARLIMLEVLDILEETFITNQNKG
tara:strand:- start:647 stop:844 length:198 start_codon:yes stop_codon:yes gene_type:complete